MPAISQSRQVQIALFSGLCFAQADELKELVGEANVVVQSDVEVSNITEADLNIACEMMGISPKLTRFW